MKKHFTVVEFKMINHYSLIYSKKSNMHNIFKQIVIYRSRYTIFSVHKITTVKVLS